MPKPVSLLLGIASVMPLVLVGVALVRIASTLGTGSVDSAELAAMTSQAMTVLLVSTVLLVPLLGVCLWHLLVRRTKRGGSETLLWVLALLAMPQLALPLYWWQHIWPASRTAPADADRQDDAGANPPRARSANIARTVRR